MSTTKAFLVGVETHEPDALWEVGESLIELAELSRTAGLEVVGEMSQVRERPHTKFYVGSGKLEELRDQIIELGVEVLITDDELTPSQQRTLEMELKIKVMDRTGLILDIFAGRAQTFEAQLQVELAQLEYLKPRLTKMWTHLSRLGGGGVGTRGPGEKQLETDKRLLGKRIAFLKKDLVKVREHRKTQRTKRQTIPMVTGTLVGYTNAGKSTLLNALTQAEVLAEDKLFATLDPTTRRLKLPTNEEILLTDTVGFIQKLPHQLVTSFRATLEEVAEADFLLHIVDISHPKCRSMIETARSILEEIGAQDKPQFYVLNKMDLLPRDYLPDLTSLGITDGMFISAIDPNSLTQLLERITEFLKQFHRDFTYRIAYSKLDVLDLIHKKAEIKSIEYKQEYVEVHAELNGIIGEKLMGMLYKTS